MSPKIFMGVMIMEFDQVLQLISNYAFPIVCCVALFWQLNKDQQQHREESEKFTTAINNNTAAMKELILEVKAGRGA